MPNSISIALADGPKAVDTGSGSNADLSAKVAYQIFDAAGQPVGDPVTLLHDVAPVTDIRVSLDGALADTDHFTATPRADGGFDVFLYRTETSANPNSLGERLEVDLVGFRLDAHGGGKLFFTQVVDEPLANAITPVTTPRIAELDGGRVAATFTTFHAGLTPTPPTVHLALSDPNHLDQDTFLGVYADVVLPSAPDAITHANGDITLTWNEAGGTFREVLGEDGHVLAARGLSRTVDLTVNGATDVGGFNQAHDQIVLHNADGSVASGATSTLTFDARTHVLSWDPDSQGPAAASTAAVLGGVTALTVANLADAFRPEVMKVIAQDGSSTTQWFDSDHSQAWDTLLATFNAAGQLTTYGSTLDDGTGTTFHFDVDGAQPWQRYVDQTDAAGQVLARTVLYDDGTSWTAKFLILGGQVVNYELDSFDANGRQVGQSFFNPDGTPLHGT
jgi:hypothetical protein